MGGDGQFQNCSGGFNPSGTFAPDRLDPPELEFYRTTAMRVGPTSRVIAHTLLYAPSPQEALGSGYGLLHGKPDPHEWQCSAACALNQSCNGIPKGAAERTPAIQNASGGDCHGPHLGIERWVGPADGDFAAEPMQSVWERPFRWRGAADSTIARVDDWPFGYGGLIWKDHHVFVTNGSRSLVGTPQFRMVGMFAPANAVFTTGIFRWPDTAVWINANASWNLAHNDEGVQSYLMFQCQTYVPS